MDSDEPKPKELKKAFFDKLYALHDGIESEDENDVGLFSLSLAKKPTTTKRPETTSNKKEKAFEATKDLKPVLSNAEFAETKASRTARKDPRPALNPVRVTNTKSLGKASTRGSVNRSKSSDHEVESVKRQKTSEGGIEASKKQKAEIQVVRTPNPLANEVGKKPKPPPHFCYDFLEQKTPKTPIRKRKTPAKTPVKKSELFDGCHFCKAPIICTKAAANFPLASFYSK
jgi:hypothetical protein